MLEPCKHILPLLDYEVKRGNHIRELYLYGGSIELTVNMIDKMDIDFEVDKMELSDCIVLYLRTDPHYELQIGFKCEQCHQLILGPSNYEILNYWKERKTHSRKI